MRVLWVTALASIMSEIAGEGYRPRASNTWSAADIEDEVRSAAAASATSLPWSRRSIARLPPSIASLSSVTSIFLDRNALTSLPSALFKAPYRYPRPRLLVPPPLTD